MNVEKIKPAERRKKNYIDDVFVDPAISMNAMKSYVNESPAYNAIEWLKKLVGWFKGSNEEAGEYLGKTVIDDKEVGLADSDYIGNLLGKKARKVNLGASDKLTGNIVLNPYSYLYGYPIEEVLGHELEHLKNPHAGEWKADMAGREYALKRLGVFN